MVLRSKSGVKRAKTSKKKKEKNVKIKQGIKQAFKAAERAIAAKSSDVLDLIKRAASLLDKAAKRGIIHKNKASRKKSRLMVKLTTIKG